MYIIWDNNNDDNINNDNNVDGDDDTDNNNNHDDYNNYNNTDNSLLWYIISSYGYFFCWRWGSIVPQFPRTMKQDTCYQKKIMQNA